jgi:hypothetical protein
VFELGTVAMNKQISRHTVLGAARTALPILVLASAALSGCGSDATGRETAGRPSTNSRAGEPGGVGPALPAAGSGGSFRPGVVGIAGDGSSDKPPSDPNVCASASISASRITPTVYLVLDGSGSMDAEFGSGTRWSVLRDALIGENGVVTQLESVVEFGSAIYSNSDPNSCPSMSETAPALQNLRAIEGAFPAREPGGGTPTGEALQQVVDALPAFNPAPDSVETAPIIILATDGEPNGCATGTTCNWADFTTCLGMLLGSLASAPPTYDSTLAAVRAAKDKNIPVWVISLAEGLNAIPDLQRTANIGAGLAEDASPGATIYSPQNPDELTNTLSTLIGDVVSCEVALAGKLDVERACEGTVQMNGQELECNGSEGWKPLDPSHIQLQGEACARFKSDPSVLLDARFPCDVVRPL